MNVLFVHNNFPAQYKHLAAALGRDPRHQVTFLTCNPQTENQLPGVRKLVLGMGSPPQPQHTHRYLRHYEKQLYFAEGYFHGYQHLKAKGVRPDVIAIHPGWGAGIFVRDAFPDTPILSYLEFFRRPEVDTLDVYPPRQRNVEQSKSWRVHDSRSLIHMVWSDWLITPTRWQRDSFPEVFHPRVSVLHEGIDTVALDPAKVALRSLRFSDGGQLAPNQEIVTYVARHLEYTRGFPTMMRAIEIVQKQRPACHFILLGDDSVGYGQAPPGGGTWLAYLQKHLHLDMSRIHMPGFVDYRFYQGMLRASNVHVYLTTGFVLSWSLLEAMSMGCLLIGSATPPVQEVIEHGGNGLLTDFDDHESLAEHILHTLREPERFAPLRAAARATVQARYALADILPLQVGLLEDLAAGRMPPPTAARIAAR